jgi:hypothetical protein
LEKTPKTIGELRESSILELIDTDFKVTQAEAPNDIELYKSKEL